MYPAYQTAGITNRWLDWENFRPDTIPSRNQVGRYGVGVGWWFTSLFPRTHILHRHQVRSAYRGIWCSDLSRCSTHGDVLHFVQPRTGRAPADGGRMGGDVWTPASIAGTTGVPPQTPRSAAHPDHRSRLRCRYLQTDCSDLQKKHLYSS